MPPPTKTNLTISRTRISIVKDSIKYLYLYQVNALFYLLCICFISIILVKFELERLALNNRNWLLLQFCWVYPGFGAFNQFYVKKSE